ncbi:MAG: DUF441 domain-containing protein [Firmicutes bacterium]|nr:DUF441 domain-containing protein [Bacillota bacterium]
MLADNAILLLILALGLLFNNTLISSAAALVLVFQALGARIVVDFLDRWSLQLGLILLTVAVLTPFTTNRYTPAQILRSLTSLTGVLAVFGGASMAYISARGVELMQVKPEIIVGLMVGTIVGVLVFRGMPVGPLAASGVTAVLYHLLVRGR